METVKLVSNFGHIKSGLVVINAILSAFVLFSRVVQQPNVFVLLPMVPFAKYVCRVVI